MIISSQHDPLAQCFKVQATLSDKDMALLTGNLTEAILQSFHKKGVVEAICKQIADKFIEENGEEILEDAKEALEDMVENMT